MVASGRASTWRRADLDVKTSPINEYIKATDTARIATLIPKAAPYPKAEEFQLSPLALGVLKYFYLSLPLLLVQIFIDFGYTIGLIFGASSMHHRSSGAIRWCLFWQPLFHGRRPAADGGPHRHSHKGASIIPR
jgi:hypothetical protein